MSDRFQRMIANLRQLKYPAEFRIQPPLWPADLSGLMQKISATSLPECAAVTASEDADFSKERMHFLAEVGTGLWRLRQRMVQPGTVRPLEEMRRAFRHLESTWDVITQAGVEIQDHTGALYDSGMSLKVIAFQPTQGIGREKILETIKPTIYYKGHPIQMGEVIVATIENNVAQ
jgi:hypothetical protein